MTNTPSSSLSSVEKPLPGLAARGEDAGEGLLRSGSIREALRPAEILSGAVRPARCLYKDWV